MKLALIDRDGVINEELAGYVTTSKQLILPQASLKGLALLHRQGFTCGVVTNQSVVGRGIITRAELDRIHEHLAHEVAAAGGKIDAFFVCTDHPDRASYRRKPKPGLLIDALEAYHADADRTPFVGDAATDMEAARAAGCPRYLVMTGKGDATARALSPDLLPVVRCADLLDAAGKIADAFR